MASHRNARSLVSGVLATMMVLYAAPAGADDVGPRTLGGLQFVPSQLVTWGFLDSGFSLTTSAAYVTYDVGPADPVARIAVQDRSVTLIGLSEAVAGSAELAPWLGITGRLTGLGEIPHGRTSTLLVGAHMSLGAEGGVLVRLVRSGQLQLTARGDAGWEQNRNIVPMGLSSLEVIGHVTTVRPALVAEVALSPQVGLQASGSYSWQWFDVNTTGNAQTLEGDAGLVMSLRPIPATLLLAGQIRDASGDTPDRFGVQSLYGSGGIQYGGEGGVFYTGRHDLDLGATVTYQWGDTDNDRRWFGNFRLGYYF